MKEQIARFGQWASLIGVTTEPAAATGAELREGVAEAERPTVILLNAGVLHHIGPHRLHVHMARRFSRLGFRAFRFDASGIGDSAPRRDSMSRRDSLVRETQEAMDYLGKLHGAKRFVLFGICSGADQAARVAQVDPRVVGTALVDGYRYRTSGFALHHYGSRLFRLDSYLSVLTGRHPAVKRLLGGLAGRRNSAANSPPTSPGEESADGNGQAPPPSIMEGFVLFPPRAEAEKMLRSFVDRGGNLCAVFTPGPVYNHRSQFYAMFPSLTRHPRVRVEYFPHANHVFTLLSCQEALIKAIESWLESSEWADVSAPIAGTQ